MTNNIRDKIIFGVFKFTDEQQGDRSTKLQKKGNKLKDPTKKQRLDRQNCPRNYRAFKLVSKVKSF